MAGLRSFPLKGVGAVNFVILVFKSYLPHPFSVIGVTSITVLFYSVTFIFFTLYYFVSL